MKNIFEIASASVAGRNHRLAGKNNQDAFSVVALDYFVAAVVTDGCGSSPSSDLGAKFGARLLMRHLYGYYRSQVKYREYSLSIGTWKEVFEGIFANVLIQLTSFARDYADILSRPDDAPAWWDCMFDWKGCAKNCLLFTIVGFVMTPFDTLIFSIGDGLWGVNGQIKTLGPFPQNAPPYIGYGIFKEEDVKIETDFSRFTIEAFTPTAEVNSIFIGTDGTVDLTQVAGKNLPGRDEIVEPLSQFWENDLYFRNPDALRRRLSVIGKDVIKPDWENRRLVTLPGLLPDDTTLVVVRRKSLNGGD